LSIQFFPFRDAFHKKTVKSAKKMRRMPPRSKKAPLFFQKGGRIFLLFRKALQIIGFAVRAAMILSNESS
jgi:hypothetical protein